MTLYVGSEDIAQVYGERKNTGQKQPSPMSLEPHSQRHYGLSCKFALVSQSTA